jgi:hypothetical protein
MGETKEKPRKIFGLYEIYTVNAVNRLLAHTGLKLVVKKNYRLWGDQIEITLEQSEEKK